MPEEAPESERLLAETRALDVLEAELAADLDFGGMSTVQVEPPAPCRSSDLHRAVACTQHVALDVMMLRSRVRLLACRAGCSLQIA